MFLSSLLLLVTVDLVSTLLLVPFTDHRRLRRNENKFNLQHLSQKIINKKRYYFKCLQVAYFEMSNRGQIWGSYATCPAGY